MQRYFALFIALFMLGAPAISPVYAHEFEAGELSIFHPYAYQVNLKGQTSNAYMTITNNGEKDDVLLRATSPIAESIDIVNENEVIDKLEIAKHEAVRFKIHGVHLRLNGVKQTIKIGAHKPITLHFEHAGEVKAQLLFTKIGDISLCDDGHHDKKIGAEKRD